MFMIFVKNIEPQPGTVIPVETGIYIKPNDKTVPFKYREIGIRIEDDVVITDGDTFEQKVAKIKVEDFENVFKG